MALAHYGRSLRFSVYGFGPIGRLIFRVALKRGWEPVAVIDIDESMVGRDAGSLAGVGEVGVRVSKDPSALEGSEVVFHATTSWLDKAEPQIMEAVRRGASVVSTCETLAWPWHRYPEIAKRIGDAALDAGVTVIGTGINPGFLLDTLVAVLSASVGPVKRVDAVRYVDPLKRRESFQKKVGIGLTAEEAERALREGRISGHVGFAESAHLISRFLGVVPDEVSEWQSVIDSGGKCAGVEGGARAVYKGREFVDIRFVAKAGVSEGEVIRVVGEGGEVVWRSTGTPGDYGTAAVVVSVAAAIDDVPAGLATMADIVLLRPGFSY